MWPALGAAALVFVVAMFTFRRSWMPSTVPVTVTCRTCQQTQTLEVPARITGPYRLAWLVSAHGKTGCTNPDLDLR